MTLEQIIYINYIIYINCIIHLLSRLVTLLISQCRTNIYKPNVSVKISLILYKKKLAKNFQFNLLSQILINMSSMKCCSKKSNAIELTLNLVTDIQRLQDIKKNPNVFIDISKICSVIFLKRDPYFVSTYANMVEYLSKTSPHSY